MSEQPEVVEVVTEKKRGFYADLFARLFHFVIVQALGWLHLNLMRGPEDRVDERYGGRR